jgi:1-acyl-sn-glycerol-3-phosphate acyltransferase
MAGPVYRPVRIRLARLVAAVLVRCLARVRFEGADLLPAGPAIYVSNHLNWADPLVLLAVLPARPKVAMFGPKEEDMRSGGRNRLMVWTGFSIPYRPEKSDMIDTTRRVQRVLEGGWAIVIMGEGRIHRGERELLPLADGCAYFALRGGVPVVPIAINGTSWLGIGRRVRVRVAAPIPAEGRANREAVDALTARTADALRSLVSDFPDPAPPGRFGRWLTELFNEWPEGTRPELGAGDGAATAAS